MADTSPKLRTAGGMEYEFVRKNVKNINLHVRADGTVVVSAPRDMPLSRVDAFVTAQTAWILRARAEAAARRARDAVRPVPDRAAALEHFTALSDKVYPAFAELLGGQKPVIKVRDMTSRWGVCQPAKRQITFALQLYNMPPAAQIYVVVHEYCHFLVPNHSPAFWAEVARFLPDWKQRRALLRL